MYLFWAGYSHELLLFLDKTVTSDKSGKFKGTQEGVEAAFKPKQPSFRPDWTTKLFTPSVAFLHPWGPVYPLDHDHVPRASGASRQLRVTESSSPMSNPPEGKDTHQLAQTRKLRAAEKGTPFCCWLAWHQREGWVLPHSILILHCKKDTLFFLLFLFI